MTLALDVNMLHVVCRFKSPGNTGGTKNITVTLDEDVQGGLWSIINHVKSDRMNRFIGISSNGAWSGLRQSPNIRMQNDLGTDYASIADVNFKPKYRASCYCGAVAYEVCSDPVDSKLCHCLACQKLHGAPMQWAAIFYKKDVRITKGIKHLIFYNSERKRHERILPCKVSCLLCGTRIADEGRRMWLAFPSLFDFGYDRAVPEAFRPTCHLFYGMRVVDIFDDLPKWSGHKNHSQRM